MTELKTRPPTCVVPWPLILVEGGEKAGKSWSAAELSASDKVGRSLWIDWGEGSGDEYGAIPGARFEMVEHDGTWSSIMGQVRAAQKAAAKALADGDKPMVLIIDSMTAEWEDLKEWADEKARRREKNQKLLERDPEAEVQITTDLWNLANARHKQLMRVLMRFPGIVVMIARGNDQVLIENGRPVEGKRVWKVDGQKNLGFDATVWVRLSRTEHPQIIGARSVHAGIVPGEDKPRRFPELTLEKVVFDILKCDPATAQVREFTSVADRVGELADRIMLAESKEELNEIWKDAKAGELLNVGLSDGPTLQALMYQRNEEIALDEARAAAAAAEAAPAQAEAEQAAEAAEGSQDVSPEEADMDNHPDTTFGGPA